jgi:hypothetical protein
MAMNKKAVTIAIVSIFGAGAVYFLIKYFQKQKAANYGVAQSISAPPITTSDNSSSSSVVSSGSSSSNSSSFPLQKGSRNNYVKQLQAALGVTVDGIFGSQTLAALQSQTGKSMIVDYNDLQNTIAQIANIQQLPATVQANSSASDNLLAIYNQTGFANFVAVNDTVWKQYNYDSSIDSYISTPYIINWKKGQTMNTNDYIPQFTTQDGYLMIYCNKGVNLGYWKANPNDLSFK